MPDSSPIQLDPETTYVDSIRSVLLIDDHFPSLLDLPDDPKNPNFSEVERARSLYRMCRGQGWLCDIDNNVDPEEHKQRERIQACDLLVLDLHLDGEDMRPALKIVHDLARAESANLVVVYTAEPKLDTALVRLAAHARGIHESEVEGGAELPEEVEELDIDWGHPDACALLRGDEEPGKETYDNAPESPDYVLGGKQLLLSWLHDTYSPPIVSTVLPIDQITLEDGHWFRSGNLFLVLIQKNTEEKSDDGEVVLDGLKAAVRSWAPSRLACLIATSRRQIEVGSFRDDLKLPAPALVDGLLRYINEPESEAGKSQHAAQISRYLLQRRFDHAALSMVEALRDSLATTSTSTTSTRQQLLHLNAFLCSEAFEHHHVRVGTLFRAIDSSQYWVCVTPACDMVPRGRNPSLDPWAAELEPARPVLALRLVIAQEARKITKALKGAHNGRYLFFWPDHDETRKTPIVGESFHPSTGDAKPKLEQMFLLDCARVGKDKKFKLQHVTKDDSGAGAKLTELNCVAVSQLRAPYAERLVHMVGHHLSRIGVDFVRPSQNDDIT